MLLMFMAAGRPTLEPHVAEAIQFLRQHEPPEGYFVGFSGGKDSIVTLELVRMAGVKHEAWHSCTRIDPPEVYRFIKEHYPEVQWAYPKGSLWEAIKKKRPPLRLRRWCCDFLKKDPTKSNPLKDRVMGMRAGESTRRAGRPRIDYYKRLKQTVYKPIFEWNEEQVWDFIESRHLPYPKLYDEGFARVGCCWCPFLMANNQTRLIKHMQRWPGIYKAFESTVKSWWKPDLCTNSELFSAFTSADEYLEGYYRGFDKPTKNYPAGSQKVRCLQDALNLKEIV